ncbi:hypothetical protein DCAR_0624430 [Daucus carota subsp. sativus]|uniref:F-box domain-containing protein n=1 Tax=Daucus carota subsp. sativus TaxID=79200 RepID=A0AAF1B554_DAUCS|nr:hypothetical protein DCAR_0624430 [Daucus carota subsp. sativus]
MDSDANTRRLHCGDAIDVISNLPSDLLDLILKQLPIDCVARMSTVSKIWRGKWEMHPHLVFDDFFFDRISQRFSFRNRELELYEFSRTVSSILLGRSGLILKFVLCIPYDLPLRHCSDIDIWIRNISNKGVREVQLHSRRSSVSYRIPSYLFSCSDLTRLSISYCILTPPLMFEGFRNLISVSLVGVKITAYTSFGAQLRKLYLQSCVGIEHLGRQFKYYINLTFLSITDSGEIDWQWFGCTRKVNVSVLMLCGKAKKIVDLEELVDNMPRIGNLHLDGSFLKFLESGAAIRRHILTMDALKYLTLDKVGFYDLGQIKNVICLMGISPKLEKLVMNLVRTKSREQMVSSVAQYLQSLYLVGMTFNRLETVEIYVVENSAELEFIKLLLASSPSLRSMRILNMISDRKEALRISQELMRFPRASTNAEIIWR